MDLRKISLLAETFKSATQKLADTNYPTSDSLYSAIEKVVKSQNIPGFKTLAKPIDVQNTIDNVSYVYFQLIVTPNQYQQLTSEPTRSQIINLLKPAVENALSGLFKNFEFKVKVGIVPE